MGDASESVLIEYDPALVSFGDLLDKWSRTHNTFRQPCRDRQYRSAIFYGDDTQHNVARSKLERMMQTVEPGGRLYISVEPITTFYRAEEHHQEAIRKSRAKLAA